MANVLPQEAQQLTCSTLRALFSQIQKIFASYDPSERRSGRQKERISIFNQEQVSFPIGLPPEYASGLVILDEEVPALPLTANVWDQLRSFFENAERQEKIEHVLSKDRDRVNGRVQRNDLYIKQQQLRRDMMVKVLEEQAQKNLQQIYSWDEVNRIDEDIRLTEEQTAAYYEESRQIDDAARKERNDALARHFELARLLRKQVDNAGLMRSQQERNIDHRRSFGWHTAHMYERTNLADHEFADLYVEKDRRKHQDTQDSEHEGSEQESAASEISKGLAAAIDAFEIAHWNRMVALDDFENRSEIIRLVSKPGEHDARIYDPTAK